MADNPSQSSEQSSRDGEAGERSEEQTNEQTGGETATNERQKAKKSKTHNAGAAQTEENAGEEEAEEQNEEETKPGEKPHIPDDFYYEVEELWRKPRKSDETLPDDLVTLYHSFGYPCRMRNNLHAIGADRLIFAAGGYLQIVVMDDSGYKYDYLPTTGGGSVGALAVHPQGKLFAVGEKGPTPVVNIFTVAEYKLYRILRAGTTVSFTAVAFNEQGDLLASQGGEPDYMLTVWNWQQESILLRCKSFSQEVNHVSFNRDLQGALTSAGIGHIKFWNMARTFTGLKLQGLVGRFGRTTLSDIEGYIEFPDGKVLSGSDWGNMLLWDENLIKLQIGRKNGKFCHAGKIMHMMIVEGEIISAGMDGFVRSWNLELIDMLEAGEESGLVEIEAMNEVLIGAGAQLYYLTQPRSKKEIAKKGVEESEIGDSAESSDEHSGSSTWYCQDGAGGIWKADLSFRNAAAPSKRILHFHAGAIVACAVSPVTHLVMTLGEDGTLRLYDFLTKKLLTVRQFKAQGSSLVWIPLSVDNKCATVMAGFADGGIRRVAIDGSTSTVFGKDRMECQLKLMQALKPHDQPVTCLAYSIKSATDGMSFLVTCSVDKTVFFFDVLGEKYVPLCFVTVLHVPRHAYCSPDQATQGYVMVTCDDGFVIEMIHPVIVDQTETLQYDKVKMRSYQFASVKSKILHDEELAKADEIEQKRLEERDEDNKMLLVKGVETPSQQELRVTAEDENAAMEKIAKEESEDPWKPYIPPVPSPILQTVYLEGDSKFWLMLGEYDAGFMYECQFNQKFEKRGDEPRPEQSGKNSDEKNDEKSADKFAEKTPLRTIRVVDAENNPITAMCFNSDGTCVFFGMQDGRIRLQFLESEFDLATERFHWSIGAHDVTHGPITGMKLSHDESFLITVGEDGIFFIFNLVPIEQLMDDMAAKGAKIPACAADEKDKADLTANQYTIEQAKQKSDYDRMLMVAERHKQDRRAEVASLGMTFKRLVAKNVALPLRHRLTPDEFVMDESRVQELKEENMLKPHDQPVTCLAYSIKSATDGMSFLVTCSVDKTLFFFDVLGEKYVPLCFVTVLHVPRHAYCSPDQATQDHVMVTCDDGFVIEMIHPVLVDQTETLQYDKVKMRSYQFASVKSKILHDEELANADEIEKKRQEERDEDNKMLLVQGVETPSQQELRVMVEDENAAKEKIAKEESEDLWKPYIPPVPSPILQTVYLEGDSKFWLMLGEYDAGFLYECQFNQKFERYGDKPRPEQSGEKSDEKSDEKSADKFAEKTPLRTIKVVDAENNPITAMCFNSDGTCVFFGMQDGRIRLQFLESEFDLATERFHWSIGAHDVTHGPITGMKLSHDESFLITVGEDGNFFIFSLVPIEQLMDDMAAKGAKIPACAADEKADLTANQYTIEQAKQKSDYDHMLMVAERHKQDRRAEVACLRMAFKRVVAKNVALPLRHRLTPDEFVMDESRVQELKEENMLKVKDMRRQTAWDCEKARLSYEKMKTYYMEHLETHRFCVKAINTDHVIYSYRAVVKPIVTMSPRHSKVSLTEMGSADDDKATSDDEDALELKRLMGTPMTSETLLGLSKRTALLLKQVEEKRLNRAKRKMVWTHFFNTKPGDDFEDPADVAAIQEAYDTMGDRHLKSDSNYIVPDSYRLTMADGSARLEGCEQRLLTAQREWNTKLLELREEKINTIHEVQGMVDRLYEIHEALDHTKHQLIPRVPDLTLSEVPGGKFNMDRSDEMRLRMKVREEMKKRLGSVNLNQATSRRESMFSKSQRKSSVVIAKENFTRLKAMAHIDIDIASETELSVSNSFHPGLGALKEKEEMELTAMQRELREIHEIELIYEQSQLIKHIQETKQIFDIHHRQLRHEKFLLDVVVECSRLRVTTLQEEQMLLRECEHVEEEIHGRIERCLEQRVDIDKCVKSLQSQLVKQGRELEELAKKEKVLYQKLEAIMGEANNFHDYLVKVYKKKIKRKVARMLTDDDEESSESESDSSDESEAEEDDEDAMQHDLNMCPVGCDENNYNDVVALREHRLDLDEVVTEVKRLRDGVLKEVDNCVRKRQSTEVTYTKALQEFTAFQLEKQKRVNNLDVLCTIQLHQIQCVRRYGEFKSITDELLIDETEVIRLQKRISELKVEKNEQKKMTIQRRKLHVHLQHERRLFLNRLEEMNQLSEKEMRSKFGKVVDLEEVETVAADLHVEDVRSRLLRYQIGCDKELLQKKNQLKCLRKNNISSLRIDSEYKKLEAGLKARHVVLEHDLNEVLKKSNMAYEEDPPEISKEMEEMMDVVATQRGAIKALTLEIEYLQGREQPANIGHSSGSYA
ncbi:cilia- and flagella-associated protein 44-like isoform X1 [Littorina saxatilis]|uniref:Cilia- and flagella-associated protein 44 n=1 Tax=Littorina saxatilis TaxID=31220 RepID=A0AAN9G7W3_9CAEN